MGLKKVIGNIYPDLKPNFQGHELLNFTIQFSTGMPVVMPYVSSGVLSLIAGTF
jgi:hypothetical protein